MKMPRLTGVQEYNFQLGKCESPFQTPSYSLLTLESHPTFHNLLRTSLHDVYFSWFERKLHLSGISLDSHEFTKASGPVFQIPPLTSLQHVNRLPPLHLHQHIMLKTSYLPIQTSACSYSTTSFGHLLGRNLELIKTSLRSWWPILISSQKILLGWTSRVLRRNSKDIALKPLKSRRRDGGQNPLQSGSPLVLNEQRQLSLPMHVGLWAAKGGLEVSLGSVDWGGPAGGRCPQVCNQLPDW